MGREQHPIINMGGGGWGGCQVAESKESNGLLIHIPLRCVTAMRVCSFLNFREKRRKWPPVCPGLPLPPMGGHWRFSRFAPPCSLVAGSQACLDLEQLHHFIQQRVTVLHKRSPGALGGSPGAACLDGVGTCWNLHSFIQKLNGSFIKISKIHF